LGKNHLTRASYLRYTHEFLFSMNIGLTAMWRETQQRGLSSFMLREIYLEFKVNTWLHLYPSSNVGGYIVFFALALSLALCICLLLRLLSQTFLANWFLRSVAGPVSLIALPACWFYVSRVFGVLPGLPDPPGIWLLLEMAMAVVCAMLYLYGKWPLPEWISIALVAVHFSFWHWLVTGGPYFWRLPAELALPITAFCSTLVWGVYISSLRDVRIK
jgi:hypothetical protein